MNRNRSIVPVIIELTDIITPKTCSFFIAELIKYVVYNKEQIPYPYEHLKMFVLKRRERQKIAEVSHAEQNMASERIALIMEKYYKKVEEAFETLNSTFKSIEQKLLESHEFPIEEIVLLFGATPVSPKDVYRFKIPALSFGHAESQHVWRKQIANLFRGIIVSDEVNANIRRKVGLTNMFVMIKTHKGGCLESNRLLPKDHYRLSERSQQVCFSFSSSIKKPCSCHISDYDALSQAVTSHLVLSDSISEDYLNNKNSRNVECEADDRIMWFQISGSLKGFKDCKSEGKSVIDLWHKHSFIL